MALVTAVLNQMLQTLKTGSAAPTLFAEFVSLHTGNPGTTGTAEVTGGSPAYARKSILWNNAGAANLDSSNAPVLDVPAGTTVTHFGLWTAVTSGTFLGGGALSASETFTAQGTYTLTDADVSLT